MANIATPYSAAILPLSVHAVETEESVSQRLYFVCKRIMDVTLTALLLPLGALDADGRHVDQARFSWSCFLHSGTNRCEKADQRRSDNMGTVHIPLL
jgi:hypothetical protein